MAKPVKTEQEQAHELQTDVGKRLKARRLELNFSMEGLLKRMAHFGVHKTHAMVSNWESANNPMSLVQIKTVARALDLRPEYLAFGITQEPEKVWPSFDELGFVPVREYEFGPKRLKVELRKWGLPTDWLRNELKITGDLDELAIHKVGADTDGYEFGDRVIVDCNEAACNIGVPGKFLYYWDDNGPVIGQLLAIPGSNAKDRIVRMVGGPTGTHELDAKRIHVVGRIRGLWRQS